MYYYLRFGDKSEVENLFEWQKLEKSFGDQIYMNKIFKSSLIEPAPKMKFYRTCALFLGKMEE